MVLVAVDTNTTAITCVGLYLYTCCYPFVYKIKHVVVVVDKLKHRLTNTLKALLSFKLAARFKYQN